MNMRIVVRLALGIILGVGVSVAAFGQYGGGTMGTSTSGGYTPAKGGYSSSTGIAIGAGAAAGVLLAYFLLRNRNTAVGCVEGSGSSAKLINEKDKKTYALNAGTLDLKPGERVKLSGKKMKSGSGESSFAAKKLVKDYGSCNEGAAMNQPAQP
jgi:subtilase family serine protease